MNPRSYHPVIQGSMLVAAAGTTAADYPGDNRCRCYQPPQAGPGVTKLARAAPGCVMGRARPGWAVAAGGPWEAMAGAPNEGPRGLRGGGGWVPHGGAHARLCDPAMSGQVLP